MRELLMVKVVSLPVFRKIPKTSARAPLIKQLTIDKLSENQVPMQTAWEQPLHFRFGLQLNLSGPRYSRRGKRAPWVFKVIQGSSFSKRAPVPIAKQGCGCLLRPRPMVITGALENSSNCPKEECHERLSNYWFRNATSENKYENRVLCERKVGDYPAKTRLQHYQREIQVVFPS
jgi:hypothetical protein